MKYNILKILFFSVGAIPIPISVISGIGTLITIAGGIGSVDWLDFREAFGAIVMIAFFVFVGMYPVSYIVSLWKTETGGKICVWTFLPVMHILAVAIVLGLLYNIG